MPTGMPTRAPGTVGWSCAVDSPAVTCPGVAPSVRAMVRVGRASSAVVQVIVRVFTAASVISAAVTATIRCHS